jgi:CRISPR-associated protein Cas1
MIKRTIYIGNPAYLKLFQNQMLIQQPGTKEKLGSIPIEDMAILLLDNHQITLTTQLITGLQGNNVVIITTDAHHLPLGMMLPVYGHSEYSERIKIQLQASEPLKKQLWKQTVERKIYNQKKLLQLFDKPSAAMDFYLKNVKSGDTTNMEGIAAQYYWKNLFDDFSRERFGAAPNNMLNFGYAILRAIVTRALVSSGLLPVLGIFHKNKYNPYCLADDIMEPYRPFVDKMVYNYKLQNPIPTELNREVKAYLLQIATHDVVIDKKIRPLMVAVTTTTASLYRCFLGKSRLIAYPEID